MKPIIVLGAGATALEIGEMLVEQARQGAAVSVLGFLDDDPHAKGLPELGLKVLGVLADVRRFPDALFVLGIAGPRSPGLRRQLIERLDVPAGRFATVAHGSAQVSPLATIGPGCVIMHNVIVSRGVHLAEHVLVTQSCCLGHDSTIGAFTVLAPNATLSGRTRIGESVYVGAGATIAPEIEIGPSAIIGIGSTVLRSVESGSTVFGNPARRIAARSQPTASPGRSSIAPALELHTTIERIHRDLASESGIADQAITGADDALLDSLHRVHMAVALEQEFGIELEPGDVQALTSIDAAVRLVRRRRGQHERAPLDAAAGFRLHHLGVAVGDLAVALEWYEKTFGFRRVAGPVDDPRQGVRAALVVGGAGAETLELVAPLGTDSPAARFVNTEASGYHVAYSVADLATAISWCKAQGAVLIREPSPAVLFDGRAVAWLALPDGQLVELIESHA
jgi:sugar O-acyltransferase (sialic acid O-acetyltransferase NeuD family)